MHIFPSINLKSQSLFGVILRIKDKAVLHTWRVWRQTQRATWIMGQSAETFDNIKWSINVNSGQIIFWVGKKVCKIHCRFWNPEWVKGKIFDGIVCVIACFFRGFYNLLTQDAVCREHKAEAWSTCAASVLLSVEHTSKPHAPLEGPSSMCDDTNSC